MRSVLFTFFIFLFTPSSAQRPDVLHYRFDLRLSDLNDSIHGTATINCIAQGNSLELDLSTVGKNRKGMQLISASVGGKSAAFTHRENLLTITPATRLQMGDTVAVVVRYRGIPSDGLIISKNKFGERTFFADNWPDRAQHWIPCNDRPSDKASVEFVVTAPSHYRVIANGNMIQEREAEGGQKVTWWKEDVSIPTKVMVIGVARFAVREYVDSPPGIPVSAWIYPRDSSRGFYDFGLAPGILRFFIDYIGPYPFSKLANVQSTTIFGGMENAGCIFYSETSVTGSRSSEDLIAHEIAHQWFGNMATEKDFSHLWLSEGFATYLTNIYFESVHGKEAFDKRMANERARVISFIRRSNSTVVDSSTSYMNLLNANSYDKGGWILHMLRHQVGDSCFRAILRRYYQLYSGSNADSRDFQQVAGHIYGKNLDWFFDQWLYRPGIPSLDISWRMEGNLMVVNFRQNSRLPYRLPLEIAIITAAGRQLNYLVELNDRETEWRVEIDRPVKLVVNPENRILMESSVTRK